MQNKQWTRFFHVAILVLFIITTVMILISKSNVESLYLRNLKVTKPNNLYKSIFEVDDWTSSRTDINCNEVTTFEHVITEDMRDMYIVLKSYHSTVKAIIVSENNEQVIYKLNTDSVFKGTASANVNFIRIPYDSVGKVIKIEIKGCYDNIVYPDTKFLCGEKFDFLVYYTKTDIVNILIELLMILFSLVTCFVSIMYIKYKSSVLEILYLGTFVLLFSLWCFSGNDIVYILFQQPTKLLYINYFCLYLSSVFLLLYIRSRTYGANIKKSTLSYTIFAHMALVVAMELMQLFNIKDIRETVFLLHIMIVFEAFLVFKYSLHYINKNKNISILEFIKSNVALCMLLINVVIAIIQYIFTSEVKPALLCIAILVYSASLVTETMKGLYKDMLLGQQSKELKKIAYTDALTKLKNRNAFISDTKDIELESLVIIAFDLNNLKYYNDNFGHDKGDKLLIAMADIMRDVFGSKSYRIGGDEFCVIMRETDSTAINSLLVGFEQKEKEYNAINSDGIKVQAAYGYCKYDGLEEHDINYMINAADELMYEHKRFLKGNK